MSTMADDGRSGRVSAFLATAGRTMLAIAATLGVVIGMLLLPGWLVH